MENLKDFTIKFRGLSNGKHEFDYLLGKPFFDAIAEDGLQDGRVNLKIILTKEDRILTFDFHFKGSVNVMCDRCLEYFDIPFSCTEKLYVKFGETEETDDDNLIFLREEEFSIDLSEYLMQYVIINLPMQRIHPEDANGNSLCNKDMIKRITELSSQSEQSEQTDSRWDALKQFIVK